MLFPAVVCSNKNGFVETSISDEDTHGHAGLAQRCTDLFLHFQWSLRQAVVLPRGKSLRCGESDLYDNIVARMGLERPWMRREAKAELRGWAGIRFGVFGPGAIGLNKGTGNRSSAGKKLAAASHNRSGSYSIVYWRAKFSNLSRPI